MTDAPRQVLWAFMSFPTEVGGAHSKVECKNRYQFSSVVSTCTRQVKRWAVLLSLSSLSHSHTY